MRKKIALQVFVSNLSAILNFATTIALARILTPSDIGSYSIGAAVIAIFQVVRDFGVSDYLRKEKDIDSTKERRSLGLLILSSWSVALLLFLSSSIWGEIFRDARVSNVIKVQALGFIFMPFGVIPSAHMSREFDVAASAKASILALTLYCASALIFASNGMGYMALAWANIINVCSGVLFLNIFSSRKVSLIPSFDNFELMLRFGVESIGVSLLKTLDSMLPDLFLGRKSTPENVAFYSRANSTVSLIGYVLQPTINYFGVTSLSKAYHAKGTLGEALTYGTLVILALAVPVYGSVWLFAHEMIYILYGEAWLTSAGVVPWVVVHLTISSIFLLLPYAAASVGSPRIALVPIIVSLVSKTVFVVYWFDGSLMSFVSALVAGVAITTPLNLYIYCAKFNVSLRKFITGISLVLIAGMLSTGIGFLLRKQLIESFGLVAGPAVGASFVIGFYLLILWPSDAPIIREIKGVVARREK